MSRGEAAADAIHQLPEFILADLGGKLFGQCSEHAAPLRGDLTVKQVVESRDHIFRDDDRLPVKRVYGSGHLKSITG